MASPSSIGQFLRAASLWSRPGNVASNPAQTGAGNASTASKTDPVQASSTKVFLSLASLSSGSSSNRKIAGLLELGKALPSIKASRKNAARERLAQLKTQIEALQRFFIASGPNASKAMAALLKTLAAELKSVASELSRNDGGDSGASAVVTLNPDSLRIAAGPDEAGSAEAAADEASAGETGEAAEAAAAEAATADAAAAAADDMADEADGTRVDADQAGDQSRQPDAAAGAAQSRTPGETQDDERSGRSPLAMKNLGAGRSDGASPADRALLAEVAGKLKMLIAMAKAQLQGEKSKDLESAEASLKEVEELASP